MQTRDLGVIDPANMTEDQAVILGHFLGYHREKKTTFFDQSEKTLTIRSAANKIKYKFKFKNDLYFRLRASDPNQVRIEVIDKTLLESSGDDARQVFISKGHLSFLADGSVKYTPKPRVVKAIREINYIAQHECEITSYVAYMHAKPFTTVTKEFALDSGTKERAVGSAQTMKFLPGQQLREIIKNDKPNNELKLKTRLKLSLRLLQELKKLHQLGLIHRDIKTENIIVSPDNQTTIIDFGLSLMKNEPNLYLSFGTPAFRAPEQAVSLQDLDSTDSERPKLTNPPVIAEPTDVFGAGRVLASLWRLHLITAVNEKSAPVVIKIDGDSEKSGLLTEEIEALNLKSDSEYDRNNFNQLTGLSQEQKDQIVDVIKSMTRHDTSKRPSVDDCIHYFEELLHHITLAKVEKSTTLNSPQKHTKTAAYRNIEIIERLLNTTATNLNYSPAVKFSRYKTDILGNLELAGDNKIFLSKFLNKFAPKFKKLNAVEAYLNENGSFADAVAAIKTQLETIERHIDSDYDRVEFENLHKQALALLASDTVKKDKQLKNAFSELKDSLEATLKKRNNPQTFGEFLELSEKRYVKFVKSHALICMQKLEQLWDNIHPNLMNMVTLIKHNQRIKAELDTLISEIAAAGNEYASISNHDIKGLEQLNIKVGALEQQYNALAKEAAHLLRKQAQSIRTKLTLFSNSYPIRAKIAEKAMNEKSTNAENALAERVSTNNSQKDKTLVNHCDKLFGAAKSIFHNNTNLKKFKPLFAKIDNINTSDADPQLQALRDNIISAVENYIHSSLSSSGRWLNFRLNMLFNLRAASSRRIASMHAILDAVQSQNNIAGLRNVVTGILATITANTPNSQLAQKVNAAIDKIAPAAPVVVPPAPAART